jgi:hypothetical protein
MSIFIVVLTLFTLSGETIFYIHKARLKKRLSAVKGLEELGRLITNSKTAKVDELFLRSLLQSKIRFKNVLSKHNKIVTILALINVAFILVISSIWLFFLFVGKPAWWNLNLNQQDHDRPQRYVIYYIWMTIMALDNVFFRRHRIMLLSSIINKFKEFGMEEKE